MKKQIFGSASLVLLLCLMSSCDSSRSDGPSDSIVSGRYVGSFERIQHFESSGTTYTTKGSLNFEFEDSTYRYTAIVSDGSVNGSRNLQDRGKFILKDRIMVLDDFSNLLGACCMPSLYLGGEYQYRDAGGIVTILQRQNNVSYSVSQLIVLVRQN